MVTCGTPLINAMERDRGAHYPPIVCPNPRTIIKHNTPQSRYFFYLLLPSFLNLHLERQTSLLKPKGVIALPDLRRYYHASQLARIIDWNIHQ